MQLKQKITSFLKIIQKLPLWITIPVAVLFVAFSTCLILLAQERTVEFSYNSDTCVRQPIFLPSLSKLTAGDSGFKVKNDNFVKIGDLQLFSLRTCFNAKKSPTVGTKKLNIATLGGWFGIKTFKLIVPSPPVARIEILSQPLPTLKPLEIPLNMADSIFDYQFEVGDKVAACPIKDKSIHCDIKSLSLLQGTSYDVKLIRLFDNEKISTLASKTINTLTATAVVGSSISQDQIVYDKPKTFTFDFDKDVINSNIILEKIESDKRTAVETTVSYDGKRVTVTVANDLERNVSYEFSIDKLESQDGSTLAEPYKLNFTTSDGPSVVAVNVDPTGTSLSETIVLTFDQGLSDSQTITDFVSATGVATSIWKDGNQVFIGYANASVCNDINVHVNPGLVSDNGVTQNDSWQFSTRTNCYTTLTIGNSVGGRPIVAYVFGSGSQTILYTGSIHGNELSTYYLMNAWVDELDANFYDIPADKKIVVIPNLNPDGRAEYKRYNSNGVDLNRNFPTADWQTDIYSPTNQPIAGGGGATPLSEPESQAIANYTTQLQPKLTMSFHSSAGYAIGNQAGDSAALAATYESLAGYRNMTGVGGAFSYPITGTYDDWIREKYGLASVLIELSSNSSSEFARNKSALWKMAKY